MLGKSARKSYPALTEDTINLKPLTSWKHLHQRRENRIKFKSDASKHIIHETKELQKKTRKKAMRYHSDEKTNLKANRSVKCSKIREQISPQLKRAPLAQIAFVERRFRTIFDITPAAPHSSYLRQSLWSDAAMDAIDKMSFIPTKHVNSKFVLPSLACFPSGPPS